MSLIAFHRFLILTAILFSLGFAVRQFSEYWATGTIWGLGAAVVLGIVAAALGYYLAHLRNFLRLPPSGANLGTGNDKPSNNGNGGRPWQPPPAPQTGPERLLTPHNGRDTQEQIEFQEKHPEH
jgi:hypothetical protein